MGEAGSRGTRGELSPGPRQIEHCQTKIAPAGIRGRWAPLGPLRPTSILCSSAPPVHLCSMQSTVDIAYTFIGGSTNLYFLNLYNYIVVLGVKLTDTLFIP